MKLSLFALIIFSVSISSIAQVVLKSGMSSPSIMQVLERGTPFQSAVQIIVNPWVLGGLGLYFFGALVWLFVLVRVEVSVAYPFVGLGFILTMILGKVILGEAVTASRLIGTLFVVAGVILIAHRQV